ncbi:MAG: double zinc ribbon domain-containing protein [Eggerthellaceae bacterium]|nr:double zinc ribbon domain-containing protein [Eggerthellaceae bacterium]
MTEERQQAPRCRGSEKAPSGLAGAYAQAIGEVFTESIWPTRCAICDRPGEVLCQSCRRNLPYIDHWNACQRCGAPFGKVVCSECNPVSLRAHGDDSLPFSECSCVSVFNSQSAAIITTYKDQGERRLVVPIADMLAQLMYPARAKGTAQLQGLALSFIPASLVAYRRRGFDHAQLLAETLAEKLGLACVPLFKRPKGKDQRRLSRWERLDNMGEGFQCLALAAMPREVLLIDDVYTTGSTLISASKALAQAGVESIRCATFARVF